MARAVPARLTAAQGRRFAFAVGGAMLVLAGIMLWRGARVGQWFLGPIGAALIVAGVAVPTRLGPVERAWMAFAVAINEWLTVMTSSPAPMPTAMRAKCNAVVQLETAQAWAAPT